MCCPDRLALRSAKSLVELQGGTFDPHGEAGAGTTVTARFPADYMVS
ncbi:MAG: hypothetical protein V3S40_12465 [Kiloniellales bacterium]